MMTERQLRIARVPCHYHGATLETCDRLSAKHVGLLREYAATPRGFCVLTGGPGSGKTYAAVATMQGIIHLGTGQTCLSGAMWDARFITEGDYLKALQANFAVNGPDRAIIRPDGRAGMPQLIVLDDLGAAARTAWGKLEMAQLIDRRYRDDLPTIITTNHDLDALAAVIDARTVSRLVESDNVYSFGDVDLRMPSREGGAT